SATAIARPMGKVFRLYAAGPEQELIARHELQVGIFPNFNVAAAGATYLVNTAIAASHVVVRITNSPVITRQVICGNNSRLFDRYSLIEPAKEDTIVSGTGDAEVKRPHLDAVACCCKARNNLWWWCWNSGTIATTYRSFRTAMTTAAWSAVRRPG